MVYETGVNGKLIKEIKGTNRFHFSLNRGKINYRSDISQKCVGEFMGANTFQSFTISRNIKQISKKYHKNIQHIKDSNII